MQANPEKAFVLHTWQAKQTDWNNSTVTGGEGAWFWDEQGKRYLDLSSQAECSHLGHQHPAVVAAIQQQAGELCFIHNAWGATPRAELARLLIEKSGLAGGKVYFTLSGAESTEHAVKMARWITGRPKIISRQRSYHGATANAIALSGDSRNWTTPSVPDLIHALPPYCYRCPFGQTYPACGLRCAGHIADLIEWEGPQQVAAVIVEPVVGTNGLFVGPGDYWRELRAICDRYGVLLIADEVMTGFGRTGEWFAWQHWADAAPDMMLLAKGLTAAHLPLGAVVLNERCATFFDDHPLPTGLTYAGHPLCCAAGVAASGDLRARGSGTAQPGAWRVDARLPGRDRCPPSQCGRCARNGPVWRVGAGDQPPDPRAACAVAENRARAQAFVQRGQSARRAVRRARQSHHPCPAADHRSKRSRPGPAPPRRATSHH